jgi:CRP-like cAMP-binding protein
MERFFRILMERSLIANQQRLIDNMALSAEERYKRFCERFSTIKYNVPQKQIASYLGVTPEFFSKMKKKLLMEK